MTDPYEAFNVADRLAPLPESRDQATPMVWVRHYAATALAAHYVFRKSLPSLREDYKPGSRPDLGLLSATATSATAAAVALLNNVEVAAGTLWDLTPELGALNGEWEEWLVAVLDRLGVNPADINPYYEAADFRSPSVGQVA